MPAATRAAQNDDPSHWVALLAAFAVTVKKKTQGFFFLGGQLNN